LIVEEPKLVEHVCLLHVLDNKDDADVEVPNMHNVGKEKGIRSLSCKCTAMRRESLEWTGDLVTL